MRSILVPVADRPECATALEVAFQIGRALSANVMGLHIRPHDREKIPGARGIPYMLRTSSDWQEFLNDDEIHLDSKAAEMFFKRLVEKQSFTFSRSARYQEGGCLGVWHETKGSPEKVLAIVGPMSDLIVVSRPSRKKSRRAQSFLLSSLMHSGRPVLMLPERKPARLAQHVLIAWNQSPEAAAAVAAAMPLIRQAESVHIIAAGSEYKLGPKAKHLQQYLKYWNIAADCVRTPGQSVEKEIVSSFSELKADLLVMGAYSRGDRRERIFGGITDHILNRTILPTLMLHP